MEDSPEERLVYEKFLRGSPFQVLLAATVPRARQLLKQVRPAAIILDIILPGEEAWTLLAQLKRAGLVTP